MSVQGGTQATASGAGVKGIMKEWQKSGQSDVSAPSIQQTEATTAVRSTVSEVAELAQKKKKHETVYLCTECNEETRLQPNDAVRCQSCGNRILYKRRGDVPVQYEAR
eukprot:Rhum_TRINITY_DN23801_c0_g2::Rhum_TRINITY_DN23801_c0_g2_i1::g.178761::m.178761